MVVVVVVAAAVVEVVAVAVVVYKSFHYYYLLVVVQAQSWKSLWRRLLQIIIYLGGKYGKYEMLWGQLTCYFPR